MCSLQQISFLIDSEIIRTRISIVFVISLATRKGSEPIVFPVLFFTFAVPITDFADMPKVKIKQV